MSQRSHAITEGHVSWAQYVLTRWGPFWVVVIEECPNFADIPVFSLF